MVGRLSPGIQIAGPKHRPKGARRAAATGLTNGTHKLITSGGISGTLAASGLSGTLGDGGTGTLQINNGGAGNNLELVVNGLTGGNPYDVWSGAAAFDADPNNDGLKNGQAWMLGATDKDVDATGLLPKVSQDAGALVMTFCPRLRSKIQNHQSEIKPALKNLT